MPIEILVDEDVSFPDTSLTIIEKAFAATADKIEIGEAQVCIRVCGEAESQALNLTYREQDKPTNVLSFPAELDLDEVSVLGDIALCWPIVEAEAVDQAKTVADHTAHLSIHGLLHLSGYDHQADDEAQVMEDLEREILASMGIADPYQ